MDREDWAWAAGFYEGEGCVTYNSRSLYLKVAQKELEPLEKFRNIVGDGKIYLVKREHSIYNYELCGAAKVHYVFNNMWSQLSPRRQDQFYGALQKWEEYQRSITRPKKNNIREIVREGGLCS